jgi:hypothetical protein
MPRAAAAPTHLMIQGWINLQFIAPDLAADLSAAGCWRASASVHAPACIPAMLSPGTPAGQQPALAPAVLSLEVRTDVSHLRAPV